MKAMERNVMRLVAVQHLRAAHGIKIKNWNKNKAATCKSTSNSTKVFGVPLENLPYYNMESGNVPRFLVEACLNLAAHVDTEGLFRKSGSVIRLKALRAKLDAGEECLSTALPCDVAGLVKQFFRELPEPVFPAELHEAFLKAQKLSCKEERTAATMLLSCVLPDRNQSLLRHLFEFLHSVSIRSAENKMDSSNLSVILAPNLLQFGDATEKMNANTEKHLKLQAAVVHCFIENAYSFGVLPESLQEKVPSMMGCETASLSPQEELQEPDLISGIKRRPRRSFGVFSSATPVIATPSSKRKLPLESGHSFGFSNKKRRSIIKSLGIDLLPDSLFNSTSTPGSACSASEVLDASQNTLTSAGRSQRRPVTSARRKSRRFSGRHAVNRVESGKAGCFSPKVNKKEAPRKSLRMRFSLSKGSKEAGSESIGGRLASQESTTNFCFTREVEFSPSVVPKTTEPGTKYISKSEDNLLTPQCVLSARQAVWAAETPVAAQDFLRVSFTDTPVNICLKNTFTSEPTVVISKPSQVSSIPMKLCCASSAESLESEGSIAEAQSQTSPTQLKKAFTESGSDLQAVVQDSCVMFVPQPETPLVKSPSVDAFVSAQQTFLANNQNITFDQIDIAALTPLHIDSVVFDSQTNGSPGFKVCKDAALSESHNGSILGELEKAEEQVNCSRLIDALDIQSPAHFKLGVSFGLQSTPFKPSLQNSSGLCTPPRATTEVSMGVHEQWESSTKAEDQEVVLSPHSLRSQKLRVAEHIQHFNKLTLHSPKSSQGKRIKSPLKFQRTPVRQTVRRFNSLLGDNRRPSRSSVCQGGQVLKTVSLESGLSPHPQVQHDQEEPQVNISKSVKSFKRPPPVPPKKPSTVAHKPKLCALGDVTNKVQPKTKLDTSGSPLDQSGPQKPFVQQVVERNVRHYRGSPQNPLNQTRLMSATKPVDL